MEPLACFISWMSGEPNGSLTRCSSASISGMKLEEDGTPGDRPNAAIVEFEKRNFIDLRSTFSFSPPIFGNFHKVSRFSSNHRWVGMPYSSKIDQDGCFRSNNKTGYLGVSHQGKRFRAAIYNGVYDEKLGVFDAAVAVFYKNKRRKIRKEKI